MSKLPLLLAFVFLMASCGASPEKAGKGKSDSSFVYKEMMVKGTDTGMVKMGGARRVNLSDVLCQQWQLSDMEDVESIEQVLDKNNKRIIPGLIFFNDSQVVENPRSHLRIGKWKAGSDGKKIVLTMYFGKEQRQYLIRSINANGLWLRHKSLKGDSINIKLEADGKRHENFLNDPFYPSNINWMIKPAKSESDSLVYLRTKKAVRFFALYYRDHIKRNQSTISFLGLPDIFEWYSGGIGLPDEKLVDDSWIRCFYNKDQAMKGYKILKGLIVNYEFRWDKKAPSWEYQTHSVLEQMYLKMK